MPSIEAVEQFKAIVQGLAREPEIRAEKGLPAEEIRPPESQLDDLADLLGGMPTEEPAQETVTEDETPESEAAPSDLDDLFAAPLPEPDAAGPSLDDLLGPPPAAEADPFDLAPLDADTPDPFATMDLGQPPSFEEAEPLDDLAPLDESTSFDEPSLDEPPTEELASLEDMFGEEAPALEPPVAAQDASDDFTFGAPEGGDDLDFGDTEATDADFPELAGFGDTKEEDVEAFDAMGEADEFQLGDFESQFGITADDHTDAELLNPAQAVDLDVEAAQKTLSLSDEEFTAIQKALAPLPLNLRLAVEELIGEKQVVFEDLDKVVRLLASRAPARTLAAAVGKILGRKIPIPAGFEKGSGAEIEARHASLWYNLRTIMLPVLRVAAVVTVAAAILVVLGWNFLLRPLKANDLYDRGLVAVKQNDGATADDLFAQAWYYWPAQERFFQYAEAYQNTGDYDRARRKYLELLRPTVKAYKDEDKPKLEQRFGIPLAPLPTNLEGKALADRLAQKRAALNEFYAYVEALLSTENFGTDIQDEIPGEVILQNPDTKGILDYSRFETDLGFEGKDRTGHYRRADAILRPLLTATPGSKEGLLRKADNFLAWSEDLSDRGALDNANSALSEYLRLYSYDAPVTWRFVRVFILEDEETELLALRARIDADKKMATDGETMAKLAGWLLDRQDEEVAAAAQVPVTQKSIEDEYGVKSVVAEEPPGAATTSGHGTTMAESLVLSEAAAAEGGSTEAKPVEITPPFKYPYSTQPFRPDFLDKVDTLLLRAMETQKSLPELHYQLSRYYRFSQSLVNEKRALAAADTYFQRLEPRLSRLNGRPALRVATSNRIGEVFDAEGQPLQAEKYFLDARKTFESYQAQGLMGFDSQTARLYRNLGNLYYRQTPGVDASGKGSVPGAWDQALALYHAAEAGHEADPAVTFRMSVIEYEKKDFAAAVKGFFTLDRPGNKGESSGRSNPNLLYAMGNALFRSGNFASAEGYYRELLALLRDKRARITDWDPVGRSVHKALAQRLYETWNNLAAAQYRASNAFRSGTPEFREALASLTTARAQSQILGRDLFEDKTELDITRVDAAKLAAIRADEANIIAKTRQEKGLVEANLQVLALLEKATPSRREALATQLEIFARIPLELDQLEAP